MHAAQPTGPDVMPKRRRPALRGLVSRQTDQTGSGRPGERSLPSRPWPRPGLLRSLAGLGWTAGAALVFALFLRISLEKLMESDGANNALQAWDMLHGNLVLHGWIVGDVTFYTFELPIIAILEFFLGLHADTMHVAEALIYLIVAAFAVAIAVTDTRGLSRVIRASVVVAALAAPTLVHSDLWIPLGIPDHTGTIAFLLASFLLVDRATGRRLTAPLLCLILCAGQISDVTVRYVAVPAIAVVCLYQMLAARKLITWDAANLLAAGLSVPLAVGIPAFMRVHLGAYLMVSPNTRIAPFSAWQTNASVAWTSLREVYGIDSGPHFGPVGLTVIFGYACLAAAAIGVLRVLWRWRTARRAEQALVIAMAANFMLYMLSTLVSPSSPHDLVALLPCGGVLAARALVPERIASRLVAVPATCLALVAALLPLSVAASQPTQTSALSTVIAWLQANGLHYGLGGYWDSSETALESANQVQVRAIDAHHTVNGNRISLYPWETNTLWFDPAKHYANFVILDLPKLNLLPTVRGVFGKPVRTHIISTWEIFVYHENLLTYLAPPVLPPMS
jgi:hypothetical protein